MRTIDLKGRRYFVRKVHLAAANDAGGSGREAEKGYGWVTKKMQKRSEQH